MKKMISFLLVVMILLCAAGCGKTDPTETSGKTDQKSSEKPETAESASHGGTSKEESQSSASKEEETSESTSEEEQKSMVADADQAMLEWANTNIQTRYYQMAFDDIYIYFTAGSDKVYRCRYDGSDVTALFDKTLANIVVADGKLWGYYHTRNAEDQSALYSIDLQTGTAVSEIETSGSWDEDKIQSVLISGNRMCYVAENGMTLVVRDLNTGEEKTICNWKKDENRTEDISMCIYGDTLYVQFYTDPSNYRYALCSYDLGSNADTLTEVATFSYSDSPRAMIWMEDGILIPGSELFYHARWSDIQDGKWDFRKDENVIGTVFNTSGFDNSIYDMVSDNFNRSRYVLGKDLLVIDYSKVLYYKGFDFTAEQTLLDGLGGIDGANTKPHGIHDGSVYIYNSQNHEILKISEGGNVEHIPVALP